MADATNYIDILGREKLEWAPVRLVGSDGLCRELERIYTQKGSSTAIDVTSFFPIVNFTQEERTIPYEEIIRDNSSDGTEQLPQNVFKPIGYDEGHQGAGFKKMRTVKVGVLYVNKRKAEESDYTDGTAEHPFRYFNGAMLTAYFWNSLLFALPFDYILIHVVDTVNEFIRSSKNCSPDFYSDATTLIEGEEGTLTFAFPERPNVVDPYYFYFSNLSFISCSFSFKEPKTRTTHLCHRNNRSLVLLAFAGKDKLYQLRNGKLSELSNISVSDNNFLLGYREVDDEYGLYYKDYGACYAIGNLHSPPLLDPDSLADNLTPMSFTTAKISYDTESNKKIVLQKQECNNFKDFILYKEPSGRCYLVANRYSRLFKYNSSGVNKYIEYDLGDVEVISWCVFREEPDCYFDILATDNSYDLFFYQCKIDLSFIYRYPLDYFFADSDLTESDINHTFLPIHYYDSNLKLKMDSTSKTKFIFANNCISVLQSPYVSNFSFFGIGGQLTYLFSDLLDLKFHTVGSVFIYCRTGLSSDMGIISFDGCALTITSSFYSIRAHDIYAYNSSITYFCPERCYQKYYIYDTSCSIIGNSLEVFRYFEIYSHGDSEITATNVYGDFSIHLYDNSIANLDRGREVYCYCYNSSTANIDGCGIKNDLNHYKVSCEAHDESSAVIQNSVLDKVTSYGSTITVNNCNSSYNDSNNHDTVRFYCYEKGLISITNCVNENLNIFITADTEGRITASNCDVYWAEADNNASVSLEGNNSSYILHAIADGGLISICGYADGSIHSKASHKGTINIDAFLYDFYADANNESSITLSCGKILDTAFLSCNTNSNITGNDCKTYRLHESKDSSSIISGFEQVERDDDE